MRIFAISGSLRATSSNTALLKNLARAIPAPSAMHLFDGLEIFHHSIPILTSLRPIALPRFAPRWRRPTSLLFRLPNMRMAYRAC